MTALIEPTDPRYFRCTSDGSYDRHTYKVVFNNSKALKFDSWEEAQACWFEKKALGQFKTIEVLDRKRMP
jgi:hypothetical protein